MRTDIQQSALTPKIIVESNFSFSIPIYQRLFSWEPEQINTLLYDLLYQFFVDNNYYYIGLLTSVNKSDGEIYELVDGQQRFTVMMLFGIVMRHVSDCWSHFVFCNNKIRLLFMARSEDSAYMEHVANMKIDFSEKQEFEGTEGIKANSFMKNGLITIFNFLRDIEENCINIGKQSIDRVKFVEYVYSHLAFFIQELPDSYKGRQLNKYFEAMNSTGRNLEQHEILKVDLLKKTGDKYPKLVQLWNRVADMNRNICTDIKKCLAEIEKLKDNDSVESLVNDKTMSIIDALNTPIVNNNTNEVNNETSYCSFLTFPDFLLQVLYIYLRKPGSEKGDINNLQLFFSPDRLRGTFKKYEDVIDIEEYVLSLYKYKALLDWYVIKTNNEGDYLLMSDSGESVSELSQYEAMLYTSSSRYTYYRWLPALLMYVDENGDSSLLEHLKCIDDKNNQEPDMKMLTFDTINRYFFRRLDYYIWESVKNNDDSIIKVPASFVPLIVQHFRFHQYNSIEHLHPQNDSLQTEKWEKEKKDCFGNLALISDSFNSAQSNDYMSLKNSRIQEHIDKNHIESLKLLMMYLSADQDLRNWNTAVLNEHETSMIKLLKASYSRKKSI